MARIRSIHPAQWTDEAFVSMSAFARLLAIALRNEADDQGIFEWKPVQLKMRLFPADHVEIPTLLEELLGAEQVMRFSVDGREYGAIRNFVKFQSPKYPNARYPITDEVGKWVGSTKEIPPKRGNDEPSTGAISPKRGKRPAEGVVSRNGMRDSEPNGSGEVAFAPPPSPGADLQEQVFGGALQWVRSHAPPDYTDKQLRGLLGKWAKTHGYEGVLATMREVAKQRPVGDVVPYLCAAFNAAEAVDKGIEAYLQEVNGHGLKSAGDDRGGGADAEPVPPADPRQDARAGDGLPGTIRVHHRGHAPERARAGGRLGGGQAIS